MSLERNSSSLRIGCAGWNFPRTDGDSAGSHLARYSARFGAVEINSSFYRSHRRATYQRWAGTVGREFRFAVKVPKSITHEGRLHDFVEYLEHFLDEVGGLGEKLGCLLVQLPPSLAFEKVVATQFFAQLRKRTDVDTACEPRHRTWFDEAADEVLSNHRIARVIADPLCDLRGTEPIEHVDPVYVRLHGAPQMYYSGYSAEALTDWSRRLRQFEHWGRRTWCIFDNTAGGAAVPNAVALTDILQSQDPATFQM